MLVIPKKAKGNKLFLNNTFFIRGEDYETQC